MNWSVSMVDSRNSDVSVEDLYEYYKNVYLINDPEDYRKENEPFLIDGDVNEDVLICYSYYDEPVIYPFECDVCSVELEKEDKKYIKNIK